MDQGARRRTQGRNKEIPSTKAPMLRSAQSSHIGNPAFGVHVKVSFAQNSLNPFAKKSKICMYVYIYIYYSDYSAKDREEHLTSSKLQ